MCSAVKCEKPQPISHPYNPLDVMTTGLGEALCEIQLSPSKALRAAKLKSRFVDIILKAQQELHNNGKKHGPCKTQQEREKLARKHQEERAKIEAEAKVAAKKAEFDLKLKIEKERETARIALQKIETSVVVDDFNQVVKELADLGYSEPLSFQVSNGVCAFTNPLSQLGLFLKEDDDDFDDEAIDQMPALEDADREEGEFCSSPRMFL